MTVKIPPGLDWEVWRVVSSPRINASLVEVETLWSYDDLLAAHDALDLWEEMEHEASQASRPRR